MNHIFKAYISFLFFFDYSFCFASTKKHEKTETLKIIFLGDSLTAGYGLKVEDAFPQIAFNQLKKTYPNLTIVNAGISGSTTASAMQRLSWLLKSNSKANVLVLALGANDGLRGKKTSHIHENLSKTIEYAQSKKLKILLCGMKIPKNYGVKYSQEFEKIFTTLAQKYNILLMPFLLEDVAGRKILNQKDGIHPNEEGHKIIAKNITPFILKLIK